MFGPLFSCFLFLRLHPSIHFVPFISLAFEHLFLCYNLANYIIFFLCSCSSLSVLFAHSLAHLRAVSVSLVSLCHLRASFSAHIPDIDYFNDSIYMYSDDAITPYTPFILHIYIILYTSFFPFSSHFHQFHRFSCAHSSLLLLRMSSIFTTLLIFFRFFSSCSFKPKFCGFLRGIEKNINTQIYYR